MAKEKNNKKAKKEESSSIVRPLAGSRGRTFEGTIVKKFPTRIVVEFERTVYVQKYERFYRKKTKLHARINKDADVNIGDYVKVRECHPLSKIIHFVLVEKIRSANIIEAKK